MQSTGLTRVIARLKECFVNDSPRIEGLRARIARLVTHRTTALNQIESSVV
jgi:hypothetical protein